MQTLYYSFHFFLLDFKLDMFFRRLQANSAEMYRCLGLVFSYYVQETDGEVDILFIFTLSLLSLTV